jgi:uncharacterized protein (DUF58 family)
MIRARHRVKFIHYRPLRFTMALFDEQFLRRLEVLRLALTRPAGGAFHGERTHGERGGAIEFSGHREYTPGDDPRAIDWSVWARLGKLVTKEFRRDEGARVVCLVDRSASMAFGRPTKFDAARRLAAALAYVALAGEDEAAVGFFGGNGAGGPLALSSSLVGTKSFHAALAFLEQGATGGAGTLAGMAKGFLTPGRLRGPLIVISDFWDIDAPADHLRMLAERGFDVVAIQVLSAEDVSPPPGGLLDLTDSETGESLPLMAGESERRAYSEAVDRFCSDLAQSCRSRGIRCVHIDSAAPLDEMLMDVLRRERVVE